MPQRGRRVPATTDPGREGPEPTRQADLPRAPRWHAAAVLAELAAATGIWLTDEGSPPGGQIGACYIRWPDGHRSVLTYVPAEHRAWAHQGAELAGIARTAGVPAPRYELVAELADVVAVVQELLPGTAPTTVTRRTVEPMLMTLRFDLARRAPDLGRWVGAQLREFATPPVWLGCWAHMSLRLVDWAIRELTADEVSAWLRVAAEVREENYSVPPCAG